MSTLDKTPFTVAEIVASESTGATITYGTGSNCSGTGQNEVLQHIRYPEGGETIFVIMRGMSRAKAQAIALILNAPED